MADKAHKWTDEELEKMEKHIEDVYKQAEEEIIQKWDSYMSKVWDKTNDLYKELDKAKKSGDQDKQKEIQNKIASIQKSETFQNKKYQSMLDTVTNQLANVNQTAVSYVNDKMSSIYAVNYNEVSTEATKVGISFDLVNESTVKRLVKDGDVKLPKKKIDIPKDKKWNTKQLNSSLLQGILQGESIRDISKRIQPIVDNNKNAAIRNARTMVTGAENRGRFDSATELEGLGAIIEKTWMATHDGRTRESHLQIDGETVPKDEEFGNGLMYPGDPDGEPEEVYNCRCSMTTRIVGVKSAEKGYYTDLKTGEQKEIEDYDSSSEKFDPSPYKDLGVKGMYYSMQDEDDELAKEFLNTVYDTAYDEEVKPSELWKDYLNGTANAEATQKIDALLSQYNGTGSPETKKEKTIKEAEKNVTEAKSEAQNAKDELNSYPYKDDTYSGIWMWDVSVADYPNYEYKVQLKEDYFNQQKQNDPDNPKWDEMLAKLHDFETKGKEYMELQSKVDEANVKVDEAQHKLDNLTVEKTKKQEKETGSFSKDAYTQERKDNALWDKTDGFIADSALRDKTGEIWKGATDKERDATFEYTQSYSKYNEPLRGIEYGTSEYKGVGKTDLNAGYRDNGERLNAMTDLIGRSSYDVDAWFNRGCNFDGMDKFMQCDLELLKHGTQEELEKELVGKTITEYGFMSMGCSKGQGFSGNVIFNIYAPSGTHYIYAEPFSYYGKDVNGIGKYSTNYEEGLKWDGVSKQRSIGREDEAIMQQNTQFIIRKVEKENDGYYNKLYVDIDVIGQGEPQRWKGK